MQHTSVPKEFFKFANLLISAWRELGPTPDASIDFAIDQTTPEQHKTVRDYLTALLQSNATDKELHDLWWKSGAGFGSDVKGTRYLIQVVRDRLNGKNARL